MSPHATSTNGDACSDPTCGPPAAAEPPADAVRPSGDLRAEHCAALRADVRRATQAGGGDVVVDLAEVTSLDSAPLGVLLAAQRDLRADGRRLVLLHACPRVQRVLRLTGSSWTTWA